MVLAVVGLVTIRINLMGSEAPTFQPWDNPASFEESLFIRVSVVSQCMTIINLCIQFAGSKLPLHLCHKLLASTKPLVVVL